MNYEHASNIIKIIFKVNRYKITRIGKGLWRLPLIRYDIDNFLKLYCHQQRTSYDDTSMNYEHASNIIKN